MTRPFAQLQEQIGGLQEQVAALASE